MCIDQTGEWDPFSLTSRRLHEQVSIAGEENTLQLICSLKQGWIIEPVAAVFLCRQDINPAAAQTSCDGTRCMDIHE
jgi:hypothetical protein